MATDRTVYLDASLEGPSAFGAHAAKETPGTVLAPLRNRLCSGDV